MKNINEIRNNFEQELIDKGYLFYKHPLEDVLRSFQRKIEDDKGIKYWLCGHHVNLFDQLGVEKENRDRYEFHAQFTLDRYKKSQIVNLNFSGDFIDYGFNKDLTSIEDAERFFEKVWQDMKAEYYEEM